jgi:hypothetical protein
MPAGSAEKALFAVTDLSQINDKSPRGVSEREKKLRMSVNFRPTSLKQIIEFIEIQDFDPELKNALKKQASRYPHAALQRFADNFEQMVTVAQRGLRKPYAVEQTVAPPVERDGPRPQGQYLAPGIKPKVDSLPVLTKKKIDLDQIDYEDTSSDLLETPLESLDGFVPVSLNINVNGVDILADSSKEEEEQEKKRKEEEERKKKPEPPPKPKPEPSQTKVKPVVFSATLPPEAFE